jgi:pSer/pThr/pTyr-binding forkhead associated (FHA) protein
MPITPSLIVRPPGGLRREFHLVSRSVTVGRDPDCDLVLDSRQVSRLHARIEPGAGGRTLTDCQSTNGTYLNGVLIEEQHRLESGDVIAVGDIFLTFLERSEGGLLAALERASALLDSTQPAQRRHGLWVIDDVIESADNLGDIAMTQRAVTLKMTALGSATPSAKGEGSISTTLWIGRSDLRAMSAAAGKVAVMITDMEGRRR